MFYPEKHDLDSAGKKVSAGNPGGFFLLLARKISGNIKK
jgi:hypothetical protein